MDGPASAIPSIACLVSITRQGGYETLAPIVGPAREAGASYAVLAAVNGVAYTTIRDAERFYQTGERPIYKPRYERMELREPAPHRAVYKSIADEVIERIDAGESLNAVAKELDVSVRTAQRAYDYRRPEAAEEAVAEGRRIRRRITRTKFPPALRERICDLRRKGRSLADIAAETGVSQSSVGRIVAADDSSKE